MLDAKLPWRDGREENLVGLYEKPKAFRAERDVALEPPERHVAIDEEPQVIVSAADSSNSALTSGSVPTTSERYSTRPAQEPERRTGRAEGHGMIFATGRPFRASTTSSPASALRIRSDNRLFAS